MYVVGNPSAALDIFQNAFPCTVGNPKCTKSGYTAFANGTPIPTGLRRDTGWLPESQPHLQVHGIDCLQALLRMPNSMAATCLSKLDGNFQGSLPQRQLPAGSQYQLDVRFHQLRRRADRARLFPAYCRRDRTHQFKLFGNYMWRAFNFGLSWTPTSGTPITKLLDHPAYRTPVKSRSARTGRSLAPGGPRGAFGRTAWIFPVNFHADYTWKLGEKYRVKAVADLFNIFDQQKVSRM